MRKTDAQPKAKPPCLARGANDSQRFRNQVKDKALAETAAVIEDDDSSILMESHAAIAEAVNRRDTAPAD
ncbi:hypothetical protein [Mesorhizobium prunaredense]|uniref:hypothetical protein n=1 Tax=Mesorhizobium prunaredense TaxID=1631249 RepID=UPI0009846AD6|nr:hypothetical protein [Mesorhizobium prunaredense]